ncbi:sperm microtubule inner protein 11-like [Rhopilema esculentum]|uniref:sperm microtubule inner protein 11-like n=1 Tax=Rhopilema esculentum TaxID=499914 RepID=UPI0031D4EDFA
MAFFNLTKLGVQNSIKDSLQESTQGAETSRSFVNGASRDGLDSRQYYTASHFQQTSPASRSNSESKGSHLIYTQRLTKHQRPSMAPNEIYRKPITSSQDHGWWIEEGQKDTLKNLGWARVERHARINSEMTRFVDEMTLTNKHFSLF